MDALVLVDIQNDFCPGGALAVPQGDDVVRVANRLARSFDVVVATQDWHPADHGSFAANHPGHEPYQVIDLDGLEQVLWPVHCVQGSSGADFHPDLATGRVTRVFQKGTDPAVDSYSGFFDNGRRASTGLADWLRDQGVSGVYVLGLATDFCVRFTALDAVDQGFDAYLVEDGCRGVGLRPGDVDAAVRAMADAGVRVVTSSEVDAG